MYNIAQYDIFVNQIISADKIILNKIDQINYDKNIIHVIKDFINTIYPLASIKETEYTNIPIDYFLQESSQIIDFADIDKKHSHLEKEQHKHIEDIENLVLCINIETKEKLDKAIGKMLWELTEYVENDYSIIRFKGIYKDKKGVKYNIQGLYDLYEINEIYLNKTQNDLDGFVSKLLIIGKNLKKNKNLLKLALCD